MKKRRRRNEKDHVIAKSGIRNMRQKRDFWRLVRTSDAAFGAVRYKPKRGRYVRTNPAAGLLADFALRRAQRFVWP